MIGILLFLTAVFNLFIGAIAWFKNKKAKLNIAFGYFGLINFLWALENALFEVTKVEFFLRFSYFTGALVPIIPIFWLVYLQRKKIIKIQWVIIISSLIIVSFFGIAAFSGNLLVGFNSDINIINNVEPGPLQLFYTIFVGIYAISLVFWINKIRSKSIGIIKEQFTYIFIGILLFGLFTFLVVLLFAIFENPNIGKLDSMSSLFFVGFAAYAIVKHKMLDIKLVILRTLSYSLIVLFISSTVVGLAILLPEAVDANNTTKALIAIVVSVLIVLILDPLKRGIAKLTDKLFFKASVNYKKLLADLSEIINREIDMDRLLFLMSKKVEKEIKLKNVSIYLAGSIGGAFYKRKDRVDKDGNKITLGNTHEMNDSDEHDFKSRISSNNPLISYLKESKDIIVLEGLERKIEDTQDDKYRKKLEASKESLDKMDAGVVAPVKC